MKELFSVVTFLSIVASYQQVSYLYFVMIESQFSASRLISRFGDACNILYDKLASVCVH